MMPIRTSANDDLGQMGFVRFEILIGKDGEEVGGKTRVGMRTSGALKRSFGEGVIDTKEDGLFSCVSEVTCVNT